MTKSRIALLLAAAAAPAAAWGQLPIDGGQLPIAPADECFAQANGIGNCPRTAEEAMSAGQAIVRQTIRPGCAEGEEEIVVCGRRDENDRHRLPLRVEPPPSAADRAGGEQMAAVKVDTSRCTAVGQNQQCTRGLDVLGIGFRILALAAKALARDE